MTKQETPLFAGFCDEGFKLINEIIERIDTCRFTVIFHTDLDTSSTSLR